MYWWEDFRHEHGRYRSSGTSFSCPIVSGVLAIYLQERPSLGVKDATQLLIDTSVKGVLNLGLLNDVGLAETTPNKLVQVKNGELSAHREVNIQVSHIHTDYLHLPTKNSYFTMLVSTAQKLNNQSL